MAHLDERRSLSGVRAGRASPSPGRSGCGATHAAPIVALAVVLGTSACSPAGAPTNRAEIDRAWLGPASPHGGRGHGPGAMLSPPASGRSAGGSGAGASPGVPTAEDVPEPSEDAAEPGLARPARSRVVSIELRDAPLDEVLRFLADAGGFGLVLGAPSTGNVRISLHRVEPFDALVTIAESNGLRVRYADGVAVVAPP